MRVRYSVVESWVEEILFTDSGVNILFFLSQAFAWLDRSWGGSCSLHFREELFPQINFLLAPENLMVRSLP